MIIAIIKHGCAFVGSISFFYFFLYLPAKFGTFMQLTLCIYYFVFHYADVTLCMTLSERILIANRATLDLPGNSDNVTPAVLLFREAATILARLASCQLILGCLQFQL